MKIKINKKWLIALRLDTSIASLSARQNSLCNSKCVSLILMFLSSENSMLSPRSMYRLKNSFSVREVLKLLHGELVVLAEALYDKLAINHGSILRLRPYITPIVFLTGLQQERPQETVTNCECFRLFWNPLLQRHSFYVRNLPIIGLGYSMGSFDFFANACN